MASQRMHWVDNLKGFLIFLVVVGHILQSAIDAHIDTEVMSCIFDWIYSFHMPLFFAASGYVYSLTLRKSLSDEKFAGKWKKRIITLIYLYFVYSFLMWGFKYCFSSFSLKESVDLTTLFFLPLKPISVYWFLYLLIIYFVIVPLWEKYVNYINCKTLLMMFVAQIVSMHIDLPFYFNRIIYMLPFFAAGTLIGDLKKSGYELKLLSCGMLTLFVVCLCDMQPPEWTLVQGYMWCIVLGILFAKKLNAVFSIITFAGEKCLPIYLFHLYVVAVCKLVFIKLGFLGWQYVLISMICTMSMCFILIMLTSNSKLYRYLYSPIN